MPAGALQSLSGRDLAVLVVEDEFLIAMELEMILEQHGCRVLGPAPIVSGALSLLAAERPDVAVLDVNLRGELVTPVAAALRSKSVPFLISSAYATTDLDGSGVLDGVENIGKPTKNIVSSPRWLGSQAWSSAQASAARVAWRRRLCDSPRIAPMRVEPALFRNVFTHFAVAT